MKKTKKIVITNHTDLFVEWYDLLIKNGFTKEDIIIYDRGKNVHITGEDLDPSRFDDYGTVIKSPNVGYNIFDYGRFIYENYDNLPDMLVLTKCNVLQKGHTTKEIFEYGLNANHFVPLHAGEFNQIYDTPFRVNDSIIVSLVQNENNLTTNSKVYPRIQNLSDFIKDIFEIERVPEVLMFAPGANYVVPKEYILKLSKNFYKKMMYYTDYDHAAVPEAHWFERILQMAWQGCLKENMSYDCPLSELYKSH